MGILDKMNIFGGKTPEQKEKEIQTTSLTQEELAEIEARRKAENDKLRSQIGKEDLSSEAQKENEAFVIPDDGVETPQISEEELAEIEARRKAENDKLRSQIGKEDLGKAEYPDFE